MLCPIKLPAKLQHLVGQFQGRGEIFAKLVEIAELFQGLDDPRMIFSMELKSPRSGLLAESDCFIEFVRIDSSPGRLRQLVQLTWGLCRIACRRG